MPQRGTPLTPFRLSQELLDRIDRAVRSANKAGRREPYNRSTWVRHAIEEKLAKLTRSKGRKGAKKTASNSAGDDVSGPEASQSQPLID